MSHRVVPASRRPWVSQGTIAIILFAVILIGGFRPMFLRLLVSRGSLQKPSSEVGIDTRPLREQLDPTPPDAQAFLTRIRAETKPNETVGIVFDAPHQDFSYMYWRANYVLTGRRVRFPGDQGADVVAYWPSNRIERR